MRRLVASLRRAVAGSLRSLVACVNELAWKESQFAVLVTYSARERQLGVFDLDRPEEFTAGSLELVVDRVRQLANRER